MSRSRRLLLREWGVLTLLLAALLAAADQGEWLQRLDLWVYDFAIARPGLPPPAEPVIVAIDEASLDRLGRWPWSRRLLADAVDRLREAGSGPVLLDLILAEPERDDPAADARLAAALARHGEVVLPVFMPSGPGTAPVRPLPAFSAVARLGHAQALLDPDGVARRLLPVERGDRGDFPHVAWHLVEAAAPATDAAPRLVRFRGAAGSFPRHPMAALLAGEIPGELLRGRIVLVGTTASGLGDNLVTPLAGQGGIMPGVEFVANVADALANDALRRAAAPLPRLSIALALLLLLMSVLLVAHPRHALLASVALAGGALLGAGLALRFLGLWWTPMPFVLAVVLAYPLWSWRRLEASLTAMERETGRIAALAREAAAPASGAGFLDPVENRIEAIAGAVDRVAEAVVGSGIEGDVRRQREEMMRHVAHDLRSPLISLRGVADELRHQLASEADIQALERIDRCARRAMYISEQFILMERADTRRRAELGEVDLVAILHQAADDLWEDARRLPARVERRCRLDGAWIRGDARLLHRVLLNLGWNALHHGPPQGVVTLSLEETGGAYRFAVHDQGKGFPAGGFASLSEDFRQSDENAPGHGLGLALVRKVAQQHGASLSTEHPPHGGFAVIFAFPAL